MKHKNKGSKRQKDGRNCEKTTDNLQNIVLFRDCNPALGCTVTFSGMNNDELVHVENTFIKILVA